MSLPNIFTQEVTNSFIQRINTLTPETKAQWGTMTVSQMLAHCSVTYEMIYETKHPKPNAILKFILKKMVKPTVVNEAPYKTNSRTAPAFLIKDSRNFEEEKQRLIAFIQKTQSMGESYFDNKESHSFGALNISEWNNMFYKHLNHHLSQFGA